MSVGYYMNFIWWGPWNALTIIHESYGVRFVELPPSLFRKKSKSCRLIVEERVMKEGKRCLVMPVCCLQGIWWADVKMYWWRFTVKAFISLARGSLRRLDIDPRFWRIILKFYQKSLYTIAPPFVVVVFYVKSLRGNGTSFSAVSGCTQIERTITLILSDGEAVFSILLLLFPEIGQTPLCWSTPC